MKFVSKIILMSSALLLGSVCAEPDLLGLLTDPAQVNQLVSDNTGSVEASIEPLAPISVEPFVETSIEVLTTIENESRSFGWVAADIGDVNEDGINDFITTDPFLAVDGSTASGAVFVYSGRDGALITRFSTPGLRVFGYSAKAAGDVNNDGVPDYIIGSGFGAFVYSGRTHSIIRVLVQPGFFFGNAVAGVGDINKDGFDDLIVSAQGASFNGQFSGRVYLISGADSSVIWKRDGKKEFDQFGTSVNGLADITGDGIPDILVGARGAGKRDEGRVFVLDGADGSIVYRLKPRGKAGPVPDIFGVQGSSFGSFFTFGAGDVDGDGIEDIFVGDFNAPRGKDGSGTGKVYLFSGASGDLIRVLKAENKGDGFGTGRPVGDINNDGFADAFIGAYTYTGGLNVGKGYLYSGKDGELLRSLTGAVANEFLGFDALSVGDVNSDGKTDLMLSGRGVLHIIAGE